MSSPDQPTPELAPPDEELGAERPLVMERLRRMGVVALILGPLLVITLSAPGMPLALGLVIYIGALVVIVAWRDRG